MNKLVAFIDILGFSSYVGNRLEDGIMVLTNANAIIEQLIFENNINPPTSYPPELQDLALRKSITSIEDYLPFSDSVFITSNDASNFVLQLGHFLSSAFLFTARTYATAVDKNDPTKTQDLTLKFNTSGQVAMDKTNIHVPPVLFRGGIAFGEVERINPTALIKRKKVQMWSLAGEAVVRAVKFDEKFKGPRIIFSSDVYNILDEKAKMYCREIPDNAGCYEILWPAMPYILENPFEWEFHYFYEYMDAAYNLWRAFANDERVVVHYKQFMELIVVSTIQISDMHWHEKKYAVDKVSQYLHKRDIFPLFSALLD